MFQDSDLKQYLDHCGNLMSMHNVKVRPRGQGPPILAATCSEAQCGDPLSPPRIRLLGWLRPSHLGKRERAVPSMSLGTGLSTLPQEQTHTLCHCLAVGIKSTSNSEHQFPRLSNGSVSYLPECRRLLGKLGVMNDLCWCLLKNQGWACWPMLAIPALGGQGRKMA